METGQSREVLSPQEIRRMLEKRIEDRSRLISNKSGSKPEYRGYSRGKDMH